LNGRILFPAGNVQAPVRRKLAEAGFELVDGMSDEEIRAARGRAKADGDRLIKEVLLRELPGARAVQALGFPGQFPVDAEAIDAADDLEVIFLGGAGYDQIDMAAATRRGILVANAPGGNAPAVAERALAFLLHLAHKVGPSDRFSHTHRAEMSRNALKEEFPPLRVAFGKVLGIVGYGHVGRHLTRTALALDMTVEVFDPYLEAVEPADPRVTLSRDLHGMLSRADFVSVHAPLLPSTAGLIGAAELRAMKPSAYLINTSRGGLVDTDALVEALAERRISGAGLDVTEPEPLPPGHPLFDFDNVVLTPHSAGSPQEMLERCALIAAETTMRVLGGDIPDAGIVNRDAIAEHLRRFPSRDKETAQ